MSGFWRSLLANIVSLPANLKKGLMPGSTENDDALSKMRRNFVFHIHPAKVTPRALEPLATLGLGLIGITLFLVLGLSGVLLMLYYVPTPKEAYSSILDIQHAVAFGSFVRALHRWAAHAMVLVVFLHLLRVFFTGAYAQRELNWTIGLFLFIATLGLAFTGYLLPWDQLSYWAVTVTAGMIDHVPLIGRGLKRLLLGSDQVGQAALIRFYALHVAVLPGLMLGLIALHLWRIRKDGGLAREDSSQAPELQATVPAWPNLVLREATLVILVLALLCFVATLFPAPLGGAPDLHSPSNPEKTPWYFLWLQEMVGYSALTGGFVFPFLLLTGLLALPFLEREPEGRGTWLGSGRCRLVAATSLVVSIAAFAAFQWLYIDASANSGTVSNPGWFVHAANPAAGMLALSAVVFVAAGTIFKSTRAAFVAGVVVLTVAVVGFAIAAWCRGPWWVFYWPWEDWPIVS